MKNVIITGASGNLGKVVCRAFLEQQYHVIAIVGMSNKSVSEIEHDNLEIHKVDLGSEVEVNQLCEEICAMYPSIEVAVFLAGGFSMGDFKTTGKAELDAMFKLNFETAYYFSKQVFLKMENQGGGRLFFMGARPAVESAAGVNMVSYALSKSLIIKLSEIYNKAGKKNGVVSTVLVPSTIDTPDNRKSDPNADFSKWVSPEKIAQTILFVSSDEGSELREGVLKVYGNS